MSHYTYPGGYLEAQHSRDNEIDALEQKLARADARIAELDLECTQWREELRIYRETESKRIAELEQAVTVRDTEIARLETDLELARRDAERYRWLRHQNNREHGARLLIDKMNPDIAIDKARAGNGESGDAGMVR